MLTTLPVTHNESPPAIFRYVHQGSAYSPASKSIQDGSIELTKTVENSISLFGQKAASISQICELVEECSEPDWDGYGAVPVSPFAARLAEEFIRALPDTFQLPEFAPEPDGSISLDWENTRYRSITLSAGIRGRFAYAWMDGSNKGRGIFRIEGERIPSQIMSLIREIMNA